MKIEDVSSVYDFLGKIDVLGFISLCGLLSLTLFILIAPKREGKIALTRVVILILLIDICIISLYIDARIKTQKLQIANLVKNNLVGNSFYQLSFKQITLPDEYNDSAKKVKTLIDLANRFPEEFLIVKIYSMEFRHAQINGKDTFIATGSKDVLKTNGVAIIDQKDLEKIDKQLNDKADRISNLLANILSSNNTDIIYTYYKNNTTLDKQLQFIDNQAWILGPRFFSLLVGRSNLKPIYDQNFNISGFTMIKPSNSATKQALKVTKDTAK